MTKLPIQKDGLEAFPTCTSMTRGAAQMNTFYCISIENYNYIYIFKATRPSILCSCMPNNSYASWNARYASLSMLSVKKFKESYSQKEVLTKSVAFH